MFAEAQAAHEGDRAALLAAINEAASSLAKKSEAKSTAKSAARSAAQRDMIKTANVNATVARDLVSNATSRVADMRDFDEQRSARGPA